MELLTKLAFLLANLLLLPSLTASDMISVEDLLPIREKQSLGIKGKNEKTPVLPTILNLQEQRRSFDDRNLKFVMSSKAKTKQKGLIEGSHVGAGFFRYRHLWWTDRQGRLIAEASIRWLRTLRVYDFEGSYLGKIHRLDTGSSRFESYHLFDRKGALIARAKQEGNDRAMSELFLEYLNSDESGKRFGSLIAHLKASFASAHSSRKKPLASWEIDIKEGQMDLIGTKKGQLDPRLIVLIGPFSTFWDQGSMLD